MQFVHDLIERSMIHPSAFSQILQFSTTSRSCRCYCSRFNLGHRCRGSSQVCWFVVRVLGIVICDGWLDGIFSKHRAMYCTAISLLFIITGFKQHTYTWQGASKVPLQSLYFGSGQPLPTSCLEPTPSDSSNWQLHFRIQKSWIWRLQSVVLTDPPGSVAS